MKLPKIFNNHSSDFSLENRAIGGEKLMRILIVAAFIILFALSPQSTCAAFENNTTDNSWIVVEVDNAPL